MYAIRQLDPTNDYYADAPVVDSRDRQQPYSLGFPISEFPSLSLVPYHYETLNTK